MAINDDLKLGLEALQQGHIEAASAKFLAILKMSPIHAGALQLLGMTRKAQGREKEACDLLRQSLAAEPRQPHVWNNLGNMLATLDQSEAINCYQNALNLKPDYFEVFANLAGIKLTQGEFGAAGAAYKTALEFHPDHEQSLLGLTALSLETRDFEQGEQLARRVLALAPQSQRGHQLLGDLLAGAQKYEAAAASYRHALDIGPPTDTLWAAFGASLRYCLRDQEAFSAFSRALELNPGNVDAHRNFNALLWSYGRIDKYLDSYKTMLPLVPQDVTVRCTFAEDLIRHGERDEALKLVREIEQLAPDHLELSKLYGRINMLKGDFVAAIDCFSIACNRTPTDPDLWVLKLDATLKAEKFQLAYDLASDLVKKFPGNQDILARFLAAARMSGNLNQSRIWAPESFVRTFDLVTPHGQPIDDFNRELAEHLQKLHVTKFHPLDQTLRGGTQTFGNLFTLDKSQIIASLVTMINGAIESYIADLPTGESHPVIDAKRAGFEFAGSWSARLLKDGFHTNHIHPGGWLSSAYYVALPDKTADRDSKQGWLKLGQTNMKLGPEDVALIHIEPRVGRLVLFPSFYWHGTTPFVDDGERLTIAFDIVPKS